jgi:hypothetical protein
VTVWHSYGYPAWVLPPAMAAGAAGPNEACLTKLLKDLLCRFLTDHES